MDFRKRKTKEVGGSVSVEDKA